MDGKRCVAAGLCARFDPEVKVKVAGKVVIQNYVRGSARGIDRIYKSVSRRAAAAFKVAELGEDYCRPVLSRRSRARNRIGYEAALSRSDNAVLCAGDYVFRKVGGVHRAAVAGDLEGYGRVVRIISLGREIRLEVILRGVERLARGLVCGRAYSHSGVRIVGVSLDHAVQEAPAEAPVVAVVLDIVGYELELVGEEHENDAQRNSYAGGEAFDRGGIVHKVPRRLGSLRQARIVILVVSAEHELRSDARMDEELDLQKIDSDARSDLKIELRGDMNAVPVNEVVDADDLSEIGDLRLVDHGLVALFLVVLKAEGGEHYSNGLGKVHAVLLLEYDLGLRGSVGAYNARDVLIAVARLDPAPVSLDLDLHIELSVEPDIEGLFVRFERIGLGRELLALVVIGIVGYGDRVCSLVRSSRVDYRGVVLGVADNAEAGLELDREFHVEVQVERRENGKSRLSLEFKFARDAYLPRGEVISVIQRVILPHKRGAERELYREFGGGDRLRCGTLRVVGVLQKVVAELRLFEEVGVLGPGLLVRSTEALALALVAFSLGGDERDAYGKADAVVVEEDGDVFGDSDLVRAEVHIEGHIELLELALFAVLALASAGIHLRLAVVCAAVIFVFLQIRGIRHGAEGGDRNAVRLDRVLRFVGGGRYGAGVGLLDLADDGDGARADEGREVAVHLLQCRVGRELADHRAAYKLFLPARPGHYENALAGEVVRFRHARGLI